VVHLVGEPFWYGDVEVEFEFARADLDNGNLIKEERRTKAIAGSDFGRKNGVGLISGSSTKIFSRSAIAYFHTFSRSSRGSCSRLELLCAMVLDNFDGALAR
jgi:hypothetical protein